MSNWKRSYGWIGHILISETEGETDEINNVIAIAEDKLKELKNDVENGELDERIHIARLGVENSGIFIFATGYYFSEGFIWYGTVFQEANARAEGKISSNLELEYVKAMKEIYDIELPPCQFMVGCSSEH